MKEFWNELLTKASWLKLIELSKKYEFVLIGGWAAYLWTKAHKSKDIDIVVGVMELKRMGEEFELVKNPRMLKYEIKFDELDVDVYAHHYSKLAIPPEDLPALSVRVEGLCVVKPEALLALKQSAEISRRATTKGKKDAIDILTLLSRAPIDWSEYEILLKKYGCEDYKKELSHVIRNFSEKDCEYLGMGFIEFQKWRKKTLKQIPV